MQLLIHYAVSGCQQKVLKGQVPDEMKRVPLAEIVPAAYKNTEPVSDDGSQDDTRHPEKSGQHYGEDDIPNKQFMFSDSLHLFIPGGDQTDTYNIYVSISYLSHYRRLLKNL